MASFSASLTVLIFAIMVITVSVLILLLNRLLGVSRRDNSKELPFECGLNPTGRAGTRLSIGYYLVACAFLIFELETALLLPWAVNYWSLGPAGVVAAVSFIVILILGLVYLLAKGGLKG